MMPQQKNTSEEKLLVEEERTEVEDTKDETNNISSVKGGCGNRGRRIISMKRTLPIDVIEELLQKKMRLS